MKRTSSLWVSDFPKCSGQSTFIACLFIFDLHLSHSSAATLEMIEGLRAQIIAQLRSMGFIRQVNNVITHFIF